MTKPMPQLSEVCIDLSTGPGELCIEFPGGTRICAQVGYDLGDPSDITRALMAQINTALAPMIPLFDVIDVAKKLFDCVQAIPDAITNLDPTPILQCIPELKKKLDAILKCLPITSVPLFVKSVINVMIAQLLGLRMDLAALIKQQERIIQAATKAAMVGNVQLQVAVDCAEGNLAAQLRNMNSTLQPLNRLIGVLNLLLNLVGLPCMPTIGGLAKAAASTLKVIDNAIKILETIRDAIPIALVQLPPIPPPDAPCK